jgi:hypothetical protein
MYNREKNQLFITDTSPVTPISEWPGLWDGNTRNFADPVLQVLPTLAELSIRNNPARSEQGTAKDVPPAGIDELGWAETRPPMLIVDMEADFITPQVDWKDGDYARGIQICQVTCGYWLALIDPRALSLMMFATTVDYRSASVPSHLP